LELEEFKKLLKNAGFNKKTFAEHINIPHGTVNNLGSLNRPSVPDWVEKFLELYIKDKKCEELKTIIKDSGVME